MHRLTANPNKYKTIHSVNVVVLKYVHIPVQINFTGSKPCQKGVPFQSHWHHYSYELCHERGSETVIRLYVAY